MSLLRRLAAVGMLLAVTMRVAAAEREFCLETLQGDLQTVSLAEASDSELILAGPKPRKVAIGDVVAFRRESAPAGWRRRTSLVWLSNGDRLVVEPLTADEDSLTVRWLRFAPREELRIPLERIAALCLKSPPSSAGRSQLFRALATEPQRSDVAWLVSGDRVAGEFAGLTAENCKFHTEAGDLPVRREQLAALRFNPQLVAVDRPSSPRYLLTLSDGSRLTAVRFQLDSTQLSFTTAYGVEAALPAESLLGCQVFSDRIQPLSERKPDEAKFTPYLSGEWSWVKDRNVLQGPLELRGREFSTGLGVHSQTAIAYAVGPQDREFRATVGLDDCAEGQGHVVFTVSLDDRQVWQSAAVTGLSDPLVIPPVDLRGGKRLTLHVGFGELGDVSDYADWCDAVIVREK